MRLHGMPVTCLKGQWAQQLLDSAATQQVALMALTLQRTLAPWPWCGCSPFLASAYMKAL